MKKVLFIFSILTFSVFAMANDRGWIVPCENGEQNLCLIYAKGFRPKGARFLAPVETNQNLRPFLPEYIVPELRPIRRTSRWGNCEGATECQNAIDNESPNFCPSDETARFAPLSDF